MCRPIANGQQNVKVKRGVRCVHVETELGVVNILLGCRDAHGREFERVLIRPDQYAGERKVVLRNDGRMVRLKSRVQ